MVINGVNVNMEMDTGATVSCIDQNVWEKLGSPRLSKTVPLRAFLNYKIPTLVETFVEAVFRNKKHRLPLVIIKGADKPICGLRWLRKFGFTLDKIQKIDETENDISAKFIKKYENEVSPNQIGIKTHKASIQLC
ncbi:hypothetical protein RF11_12118 [Thelohanellus kitauei]|uniref:Peptidase A2 domain-containing protein n=1 Tax=Thelohanellus kitauei TaxID=669202 RepID=A0A0C2MIG7_THEKT|nr:hypothetical protein RF11_12118 [Thelohanellus kitauei]